MKTPLLIACAWIAASLVSGASSAEQFQAASFTVGEQHLCGISGGLIQCAGNNDSGQLGNGTNKSSSELVVVKGISTATGVSAGRHHTCALLTSGRVMCWGKNELGLLGDGSTKSANIPKSVKKVRSAIAISASAERTCALLKNGTVYCWGLRPLGDYGDPSEPLITKKPKPIPGIRNAVSIAVGLAQGYAVLVDGSVRRWGVYRFRDEVVTTPVAVPGIDTATAVVAGRNHACALLRDNTVRCWGSNIFGQLGAPTANVWSDSPVEVAELSGVTALASSWFHTCALLRDGSVKCWGLNNREVQELYRDMFDDAKERSGTRSLSQVGSIVHDVTATISGDIGSEGAYPQEIPGVSTALSIAVGPSQSCAVLVGGEYHCWEIME